MLKGLVLSLAVILVWGFALLGVLHVIAPKDSFKSMVRSFLPAVPGYFIAFLLTPASLWFLPVGAELNETLGLLNGLVMLLLFFITAVHFYYHVARSITLRLLLEFGRATNHTLTVEQIQRVYGVEDVIQYRIDAMLGNGFLVERGGRYYLTLKGRASAIGGLAMRKLIRLNFEPI